MEGGGKKETEYYNARSRVHGVLNINSRLSGRLTEGLEKRKRYFDSDGGPGAKRHQVASSHEERLPSSVAPRISEEEKSAERKKVQTVHNIIQENAPMPVDRLFDKISIDRIVKNEEQLFKTIKELQVFLQQRQFLFTCDGRKYSNSGFGYRMLYVFWPISFNNRCPSPPSESTRTRSMGREKTHFATYTEACSQVNESWNDNYVNYGIDNGFMFLLDWLLQENENIFEQHESAVKIKAEARLVPSLWDQSLQPEEPARGIAYWDRSREYEFLVKLSAVGKDHMKANILDGVFRSRSVLFFANDLNMGTIDLKSRFSPNEELHVTASCTFHLKHNFRASYIKPDAVQNSVHNVVPKAPLESDVTAENRAYLRRVAVAEVTKANYVDKVIGEEQLTADEIGRRLKSGGIPDYPFSKASEVFAFINTHPHLCKVQEKVVCVHTQLDRHYYNSFFWNMAQVGCQGISLTELKENVSKGLWGEELQAIAKKRTLEVFLNDLRSLFTETTTLDPVDTRIVVDGIYMVEERLLLPKVHVGPFFC